MSTWRQVPDAFEAPTRPSPVAPWLLGAIPVLVWTRELAAGDGWARGWALPLLAVGLALVLVGRARPRWFPLLAAVALGALVLRFDGQVGAEVAAVAVAGTALWSVGLGVVRWWPDRLRSGRALRPALVPLAIADVLLVLGPWVTPAAVSLGLAALVAAAGAVAPGASVRVVDAAEPIARILRRVDHVIAAVAHAVGRALVTVGMAIGSIWLTAIWLLHRLFRHDPLTAPVHRPGAWVRRVGDDAHPERQVVVVAAADPYPRRARLSGAAVMATVLALVVGGAVAVREHRIADEDAASSTVTPTTQPDTTTATTDGAPHQPGPCKAPPANPALDDQEDYAALECERTEAYQHGEFDPASTFRLADFDGDLINVRDGERTTWRPPACTCPRLTVWWFGGSAAWGEGQRDEQSLPSQLAKAAWRDGIALDIVNRAMPTYTFSQDVRAYADQLSRSDPPDLVLFYDGGNDVVFQGLRAYRDRVDDESDIVLSEDALNDLLRRGIPVDGASTTWTPQPDPDAAEALSKQADEVAPAIAQHAVARYERNLRLATLLSDAVDRPMAAIWQPLLVSAPAEAGSTEAVPDAYFHLFELAYAQARSELPDEVIDLADALDDVDEPVFSDLFHTSERGADLVARALYPRLRTQIDRALADSGQQRPG